MHSRNSGSIALPSSELSHGPRSGLRQNSARNGPGGGRVGISGICGSIMDGRRARRKAAIGQLNRAFRFDAPIDSGARSDSTAPSIPVSLASRARPGQGPLGSASPWHPTTDPSTRPLARAATHRHAAAAFPDSSPPASWRRSSPARSPGAWAIGWAPTLPRSWRASILARRPGPRSSSSSSPRPCCSRRDFYSQPWRRRCSPWRASRSA